MRRNAAPAATKSPAWYAASPCSSSAGSIASGVPRALSTGTRSATAWLYSRSSKSTRACLTAACRAAGDPPPTFCASSNCVRASSRSPWARAASPLTMSTHARAPGSSWPPSSSWYTGSASTGLPASTVARARRNSIGNASGERRALSAATLLRAPAQSPVTSSAWARPADAHSVSALPEYARKAATASGAWPAASAHQPSRRTPAGNNGWAPPWVNCHSIVSARAAWSSRPSVSPCQNRTSRAIGGGTPADSSWVHALSASSHRPSAYSDSARPWRPHASSGDGVGPASSMLNASRARAPSRSRSAVQPLACSAHTPQS